jgi:hypothetical protein
MSETVINQIESIFNETFENNNDIVSKWLGYASIVGLNTSTLENDIKSLLVQRILFWLISDSRPGLNHNERKRFISRRLRSLLSESDFKKIENNDRFLEEISVIQSDFCEYSRSTRAGLNNIDESVLVRLYSKCNYRCAVCGIPIHSSSTKECKYFSNGVEPVGEPHLDHAFPYYLSGNSSPYEVLCSQCNLLKRERIGVQEDGFVISGNHFREKTTGKILRRMAFWSMYNNRCCSFKGCSLTSKETTLFVQSKTGNLFTYGNIDVVCFDHGVESCRWIHDFEEWVS